MLIRVIFSMLGLSCALLTTAAAQAAPATPDEVNRAHLAPAAIDPSLYAGGNGLGPQTAVVVVANSHPSAVDAEYAWVRYYYPDARVETQTFRSPSGGRRYDALTLQYQDGTRRDVWFDVTASMAGNPQ
jgi:hypothetical protein